MSELYKHYSHFNFTGEEWQKAADRYLKLEEAMDKAEDDDAEVDHDDLAENFQRCDICDMISELQDVRDEFARYFAGIWAKIALESKPVGDMRG